MSKIRNSLGVIVLPIPNDEYTWEEYKQRYGVDLTTVFPTIISGGHIHFDLTKSPTKLLCVSGLARDEYYPDVIPVNCAYGRSVKSGDEVIGWEMFIALTGYNEDEQENVVIGRLIITIFDDPDRESLIAYSAL